MSAWLVAAMALLGTLGRRAATRGVIPVIAGAGAGLVGGEIAEGFGLDVPFLSNGGDRPRRRRRRRALTASDRADIGFITGLLGPAAGKAFSIQLVTKTA